MSQMMESPGSADLVCVDELVSISMLRASVVVAPTAALDALGTQIVIDAVNGAGVAGSTVVLHRPGAVADSSVDIDVTAVNAVRDADPISATSAGVGLISIRSVATVWTVDLDSHRFVRTDEPVDRLTLVASDWTAFEKMWIAPQFVSALVSDEAFVTARRSLRHRCRRDVFADRRPLGELSHTA